jgi:pilus assembly protein Flp/PilA
VELSRTPTRDGDVVLQPRRHDRFGGDFESRRSREGEVKRNMSDTLLRIWCDAGNRFHQVRTGERGATAVEYGIMVALIAAVIIIVVSNVGTKVSNAFSTVDKGLK